MSGALAGNSQAGGWNHLKSPSLTRLAIDAGCQLGPQPRLSARAPAHSLFKWSGLLLHGGCILPVSVRRKPNGNWITFADLALEDTQHCFCHILFIETAPQAHPVSRGGEIDTNSWWGSDKVLEEHVCLEILLELILEKRVCHTV